MIGKSVCTTRNMSVIQLVNNLRDCAFESEAGPLVNNVAWRALIERLKTYRTQAIQSETPSVLVSMLLDVRRFNRDIIGLDLPDSPTMLPVDQMQRRVAHLEEELQEFTEAWGEHDMPKTADALLDLIYVAMGGLLEMGFAPGAAFNEVHRANMRKERGTVAHRPNSKGNDAIKPEGWSAPCFEPYLTMTRDDVLYAHEQRKKSRTLVKQIDHILLEDTEGPITTSIVEATPVDTGEQKAGLMGGISGGLMSFLEAPTPTILIIGHARHGKDTMAERLRDKYDLRFTSSSLFCAERVIWPLLKDMQFQNQFLKGLSKDRDKIVEALNQMDLVYESVEECFDDRSTYRTVWYEAIKAFNKPDPTTLARAILEDHDVYCGLRSSTELHACRNADVFNHIIWVDASQRVGPEPRSSCTVEPWMADYVVDANGSIEEGAYNLDQLMRKIL